MWNPTHVQVTVARARNLISKGKGGANDVYVTIQLGKEKYQTSVKERSSAPEWHEECDLPIPDMLTSVKFTAFNRSFLGLDDFLGQVSLPLEQFPIYERPRSRWFALKAKAGKKDEKYRGEIEVKLTFIVQNLSGSLTSLNKQQKVSHKQRSGSIINLASSVGEKLKIPTRSNSFKGDKKKTPLIQNDEMNDADNCVNSDEIAQDSSHDGQDNASGYTQHDGQDNASGHVTHVQDNASEYAQNVHDNASGASEEVRDSASSVQPQDRNVDDSTHSMFETVGNGRKKEISSNPFPQKVFSYDERSADRETSSISEKVVVPLNNNNVVSLSDENHHDLQKIPIDPYRITYDNDDNHSHPENNDETGANSNDEVVIDFAPVTMNHNQEVTSGMGDVPEVVLSQDSDAGSQDRDVKERGVDCEERGIDIEERGVDVEPTYEKQIDIASAPLQRRYSSRKRIRSKPKKQAPQPDGSPRLSPRLSPRNSPRPRDRASPRNSPRNSPRQQDGFVHTNEGPVDSAMYAAFTDAANLSHSPKPDKRGRRLSFPTIPFSNKNLSKTKQAAEFPSYNPQNLTADNNLADQARFSTSEADLYTKWKAAVDTKEDSDNFTKNRQPIYRGVPHMKRASSDAEMVNKTVSISDEVPLLDDSADCMSKSVHCVSGTTTDVSDGGGMSGSGAPYWIRAHQEQISNVRSDLSTAAIPEENENITSPTTTTPSGKQSKNDPSRRHTLQLGVQQLPKIPVHKLHDTSTSITSSTNTSTTSGKVSQSGKNQLPQKFVEQYENFAKEDLLQVIYAQRRAIDKHDSYVRDLESYIDNLLVRVMESTPKLLQNPYLKINTRPKHYNVKDQKENVTNKVLTLKAEDIPPQGSLANPVFIPTNKHATTAQRRL